MQVKNNHITTYLLVFFCFDLIEIELMLSFDASDFTFFTETRGQKTVQKNNFLTFLQWQLYLD